MKEIKICVIGLGYVGLPLARLFSTKYKTVGFDMNPARVAAERDKGSWICLYGQYRRHTRLQFLCRCGPYSGGREQQSGPYPALRSKQDSRKSDIER